jgi:2-polyprenyl-6-methoxyphenol hydroxylase-like FAD-dependent oxidoreductase
MARKQEADVVVVGAGPVGLLAALALKTAGVDVAVYDANRRTGVHSYATVLHVATQNLLDRAGLLAACSAHGRPVDKLVLYEGAQRKADIDIALAAGESTHLLVVPQSRLESILEDALASRGVRVHWEHRIQSLEAAAEGVDLVVARLDSVSTGYPIARSERVVASMFDLTAKYVIGADGYDSFVRRRLGIDNPATGNAEMFSVYQLEPEGPIPEEGRFVFAKDGVTAYWPLPDGRCRFSFPIADHTQHRPDEAGLLSHLAERAPWFPSTVKGIEWTAHALFERRLANWFGSGRVWLAGDAAHLTGPVGAQSMNVGLREGSDLAACLAAILRQGAGADTLEAYAGERKAEWRRLLGVDASLRGDAGAWTQAYLGRLLSCLPASGDALDALAGQIGLQLKAS